VSGERLRCGSWAARTILDRVEVIMIPFCPASPVVNIYEKETSSSIIVINCDYDTPTF
jgi:hypothetical protein